MRRREFISLLGSGAIVLPFAVCAHAQQKRMPIIGLLGSTSADESTRVLDALRAGLKESGFIEGQDSCVSWCQQVKRSACWRTRIIRIPTGNWQV
jgi:putative ABC transport system substrate-binding protein